MGGRLRPGRATVSATVQVETLATLDAIAAERRFGSRSQLVARIIEDFVRAYGGAFTPDEGAGGSTVESPQAGDGS